MGTEINENAKFCMQCGKEIESKINSTESVKENLDKEIKSEKRKQNYSKDLRKIEKII